MQTLDVISVNLWQIFASLANLVLLFLIIRKFLYNPVKKMLETRQKNLDTQYADAAHAKEQALADQKAYAEKMSGARAEAEHVMQSAVSMAHAREDEILADAREKADGIVRKAEEDAQLEKRKAQDSIKHEIVDVSTALAEKMLQREINAQDHKDLIDSFIESIGDDHDGNK